MGSATSKKFLGWMEYILLPLTRALEPKDINL